MILALIILTLPPVIAPPCAVPYTVAIPEDTPVIVRVATMRAIWAWNDTTGIELFRRVSSSTSAQITVKMVAKENGVLGRWLISYHEGCARGGTAAVVALISGEICLARVLRIMIHEFGHALGLRHKDSEGDNSVIKWYIPGCDKALPSKIDPSLVQKVKGMIDEYR